MIDEMAAWAQTVALLRYDTALLLYATSDQLLVTKLFMFACPPGSFSQRHPGGHFILMRPRGWGHIRLKYLRK